MISPDPAPTLGESGAVGVRWWGEFSIEVGDALRWRIGPMQLWIARTPRDLRVTREQGSDPLDSRMSVAVPCSDEDTPAPDAVSTRFGFRSAPAGLRLSPLLPDRPMVVKPESPIFLPQGEEVTLFISTPLWVAIHVADSSTLLYEAPVYRPSDTWFGLPTAAGGRSYASRTRALMSLDNLALLPQRAVSIVRIRNHADSALALERIRLPSPNLSLFASENGQLWTETVTLDRKEDGDSASVDLGQGAPPEIGNAELVTGPRERLERGLLMRTSDLLF